MRMSLYGIWIMRRDNMTDEQRSFYLLLCMTGRTQEATEYKERVENKEDEEDKQDGKDL